MEMGNVKKMAHVNVILDFMEIFVNYQKYDVYFY